MEAKRVVGIAAIVGALLLAGIWLLRDGSSQSAAESAAQRENPGAKRGPDTAAPHRGAQARPEKPAEERPRLTDSSRRDLLTRLARARDKRRSNTAVPRANTQGESRHEIEPLSLANKTGSNTDWEKQQLDTLSELLAECYDLATEEDPELAGTLGVQFTIAGEPEIGGLVDNIEIMADYSSIEQPTMRECVTESLYALELDPPPEGVSVGRQVTLRFEPD